MPFEAEIPIWDIERSVPCQAVSSTTVEGERGMYHSFIQYLTKHRSNSLSWSWRYCVVVDSPVLCSFIFLFLPVTSRFAFELMPGISSTNRQRGPRLHYFCWQLFPPSLHASYLSVSCHKFGWSKGRDVVTSSQQGYCPVLALKCHVHLCYHRNNK